MGFIKATSDSLKSTLADQWIECFSCDALNNDVLVQKGRKKSSLRTSNTKSDDNVITNHSVIIVANGECAIIVERGKIVDICANPGIYEYRNDLAPTIMEDSFSEGLNNIARQTWERLKFGGVPTTEQSLYFVNTKEIMGNKFGTMNPIPFRTVDNSIGLNLDISLRCNGEFSYRIVNPITLYENVVGNIGEEYKRESMEGILRAELLNELQVALFRISKKNITYSEITCYIEEINVSLKELLEKTWIERRGIKFESLNIKSLFAEESDLEKIKMIQIGTVLKNPSLAGGTFIGAQAEALKKIANTTNGSGEGLIGLGLINSIGNMNINGLYELEKIPGKEYFCKKCGNFLSDAQNLFCPKCGQRIVDK